MYWSHHNEVRKLSVEEQDKWFDRSIKHRLSSKALKSAIAHDKKTGQERNREEVWLKGDQPWTPRATLKFNGYNAAFLDRLYTTEKEVHGEQTIEGFVIWLIKIGVANAKWSTDKGKEIAERLKEGLEKQTLKKPQNSEAA